MSGLDAVVALVGPAVAMFVVFVVRGRLRERRSESRLEHLARTGTATLPCRVRGDRPYPQRWTHARLDVRDGGATLRMRERHLPDVRLPAGSLEVLHVRAAGQSDRVRTDNDDLVVVTVADGAGATLHLLVPEETADGAVELVERLGPLQGQAVAAAGAVTRSWRRGVPTWTLVTGTAGLALAALLAVMWASSEPVDVRVTGPADEYDYCPVAWSDPWDGRPQDAQISCWDEQAGDTIPGLALAEPFRGEIFDTDSFPALMIFVPLPLLAATGVGIGWRAWQLRTTGAGVDGGAGPALDLPGRGVVPPLPSVDADVLDVETAASVAAARSVRERWAPGQSRTMSAAQAESARWWTLPTLRGVALAEAGRASMAGLAVMFALLGGWSAWGGWLGTQGEVRVVRADVGEPMSVGPFLPDDLEVTFVVGEQEVQALVASVGDLPETVTAMYSVDDPTRARIVGEGDGTRRGMLLSSVLAGGALAWIGWCVRGLVNARRAVLGAVRDQRRRRLDYVLTADPDGDPVLLLWTPRATAPRWAVPLAEPVLGAVPVSGEVEVRGELRDDGAVLPALPERVLWPSSPAVEIDRQDALVLLTGVLPDDVVPDDDEDERRPTAP